MDASGFAQKHRLRGHFLGKWGFCPKSGFDSEFIDGLYHYTNVMTEHLAQQFIDHGSVGSASDMLAELGLDHPHSRLNIRALVIVG